MIQLKLPNPDFQENIKILMDKTASFNKRYYNIVDKETGEIIVRRSVPFIANEKDQVISINDDYCFWLRTEGFKTLKIKYQKL